MPLNSKLLLDKLYKRPIYEDLLMPRESFPGKLLLSKTILQTWLKFNHTVALNHLVKLSRPEWDNPNYYTLGNSERSAAYLILKIRFLPDFRRKASAFSPKRSRNWRPMNAARYILAALVLQGKVFFYKI